MHNQIGLFFASLNVLLALGTLIFVVHGIRQFKVELERPRSVPFQS
jgi:hypothetical protein